MDDKQVAQQYRSGEKEHLQNPASDFFLLCDHLKKSFQNNGARIDVLKDANIGIHKGETIAVTGVSGIGKSTFLHIVGTLDRPDSGTIHIQGKDVFQENDVQLAKLRNTKIGFVFQFHHLLQEFSAIENVSIPALINRMDKQEAYALSEKILVRVGLKDRLKHRVNELSGGEQQRVALARSLVLNPLLLLADEPTGNLDKKNSEQVHELLLELNHELSMTMIIVTHNADLANIMSRRITILDGQLVEA
ncbi:MAG: ABC transporter ATP-binding protein [Pseudomonadota bacterium]